MGRVGECPRSHWQACQTLPAARQNNPYGQSSAMASPSASNAQGLSSTASFSALLHSRAPFVLLPSARIDSISTEGGAHAQLGTASANGIGSIVHSLIPRRKQTNAQSSGSQCCVAYFRIVFGVFYFLPMSSSIIFRMKSKQVSLHWARRRRHQLRSQHLNLWFLFDR